MENVSLFLTEAEVQYHKEKNKNLLANSLKAQRFLELVGKGQRSQMSSDKLFMFQGLQNHES